MTRPGNRIATGGSGPLSRPFAALAELRPSAPSAPPPPPAPGAAVDPVARAKKIVLRRERKGHGGKPVTRVEGLPASPGELEALGSDLKRALGCGAAIDGGDILVQGDQVARLTVLLESRGARKIVVGS